MTILYQNYNIYIFRYQTEQKTSRFFQFIIFLKKSQMIQEDEPTRAIIAQYQSAYSTMLGELERLEDEKRTILVEKEAERTLISGQLAQKTAYYEALLNDKCKLISQLEDHIKKVEADDSQRNRREIRRYIESCNEKDVENNSLKRQINSYKNKINSLETEIANITSIKEDLELFIVKGIELLKVMNKEMSNNIEETETEKMVMESKYKQTNEKMNMLTEKINELQVKLNSSQESYAKLKCHFKSSKDECLNQKFQIEELKEQIRSIKLNDTGSNSPKDDNNLLSQEISSIIELGIILKEKQFFLKQVAEYHQMNMSLIQENNELKSKQSEHERIIEELKSKYIDGHQDESLQRANPSLFEFFQEKKAQFLKFEQTIEKIETYIEEKDESITKLIAGFAEKNDKCSCGKEGELATLQTEFDACTKKNENYQETITKLRKDMSSHENIIETYKVQLRELLASDAKGKNKKRVQKKRCLNCYISMERNDACETCADCKRSFHPDCILVHRCDTYKLDDGLSWINGME